MKWAIVIGDPIGGIELHGPFDTVELAIEWAEGAKIKESWWECEMEEHQEEDDED